MIPVNAAPHSPPSPAAPEAPALARLQLLHRGKVREVYAVDRAHLLLVTSNRVSAFDCVFPEPVPHKGTVLNLLSAWWFDTLRAVVPNHLVATRLADIEHATGLSATDLAPVRGRVALVRRTDPIRFECVVRGALDGSAWREYSETCMISGRPFPAGLRRYDPLPELLFTPTTKAEAGHDLPVAFEAMAESIGAELAGALRQRTLALFTRAAQIVAPHGISLLDTKFEFGLTATGELLLIDEVLTPDSSRYRRAAAEARPAAAYDKQFLRDHLLAVGFSGEGPLPALPPAVIDELSRRYTEIFQLITGETIHAAIEKRG